MFIKLLYDYESRWEVDLLCIHESTVTEKLGNRTILIPTHSMRTNTLMFEPLHTPDNDTAEYEYTTTSFFDHCSVSITLTGFRHVP